MAISQSEKFKKTWILFIFSNFFPFPIASWSDDVWFPMNCIKISCCRIVPSYDLEYATFAQGYFGAKVSW